MSNNGTLIIANEFHKAFFHAIFIPTFQRDEDQIVVTWNVARVCKITISESLFHFMFLHKFSNLMRENLSK